MKDTPTGHLTADEIERFAADVTDERVASGAEHLDTCGACRREVDFLRALEQRLMGLPHAVPSPGFGHAVMARVRVPVPWRERAVEAIRDRWAGLAAASAAAAVAVGAMSYWLFGVQQLTPLGLAGFVLDSARVLALRGLIAAGQLSYSLGLTRLADAVLGAGWAPALAVFAAMGTAGLASMMIMLRLMHVRASRSRVARS